MKSTIAEIKSKCSHVIVHTDKVIKQVLKKQNYIKEINWLHKLHKMGAPHISTIIHCDPKTQTIIMPNHGDDIWTLLDQNYKFTDFDILRILISIAEFLDFIHRYGIVHNDIKTENIIYCTKTKRCTIIDHPQISQVDSVKGYVRPCGGTPQSYPPERYLNRATEKSDMWSFGIVASLLTLKNEVMVYDRKGKVMDLLGVFKHMQKLQWSLTDRYWYMASLRHCTNQRPLSHLRGQLVHMIGLLIRPTKFRLDSHVVLEVLKKLYNEYKANLKKKIRKFVH